MDSRTVRYWNFSTVHCCGIPQLLEEEENLAVLTRLVAHFECQLEEPMFLDVDWGRPVAQGTVGIGQRSRHPASSDGGIARARPTPESRAR
jgi:hypothetical protein